MLTDILTTNVLDLKETIKSIATNFVRMEHELIADKISKMVEKNDKIPNNNDKYSDLWTSINALRKDLKEGKINAQI